MSDSITIFRKSEIENELSNLKPSSSKQINNNFKQDHKDFVMGNVGKLSVNLSPSVLTNLTPDRPMN